MWKIENNFSIRLGGNTFINVPNIIVFKGQPLFQIRRGEDGMLGIDFQIHDARQRPVATFAKGVVVEGDAADYDVKTGHTQYVVTEKGSGTSVARVQRREVAGAELDVWIRTYLPNGMLLDASPTSMRIGNTVQMCGNTIMNCGSGIPIN